MTQDKGKLVHSHPANELTEKLFGFESVINKTKSGDADATTFDLDSDAVPANKIWVITRVTAWNEDGAIVGLFILYVNHDGTDIKAYTGSRGTPAKETVDITALFYLDAEDYFTAEFYLITIGETCYINIFGYEMNAP